ncbi:hypothetical protein HY407_01620 [Candidatus Gottesmanbacteria bacterium]|nr:hypothetical protein [Candidatus Gottesmanbacteria bacterium]
MKQKTPKSNKGKWILIGIIILILTPILAGSLYVYLSNRNLYTSDEDILKTYKPSNEIEDIINKTKLTDKGKALLYRSDPQFVDQETFQKACGGGGREPLGCYSTKLGGIKIYLLQIDDPELSDSKYFITMHEMLHAAFFRMNEQEKEEVSKLVQPEFAKRQDDGHLVDIVLTTQDDGVIEVVDQLHSYLGSEYENLSPELEEHYKKYFQDRQIVIDLYKKSGYGSRVKQIDQLRADGKALYTKIQAMAGELTAAQNASDKSKFNSLIGEYESLSAQYNSKRLQSEKLYSEIEEYYKFYNPDYTPPPPVKAF